MSMVSKTPRTAIGQPLMGFKCQRQGIVKSLLIATGLLVVAYVITQAFSFMTGRDVAMGLIPLFNLNAEANLPTFFSTLLLSCSSVLLVVNAMIYRQFDSWFVKYWIFLALIFAFLSIDELSSLHERLTVPVRNSLDGTGVLYYAWVLPYAAFVVFVGAVMLRFMLRIERDIAVGFILAGTIFIMGAAGMEMLGGDAASKSGEHTIKYVLFVLVEETMEMLGIIIFINYILKDIFSRVPLLSLSISDS